MSLEPRLPFNAHLLESKFEAFSFSVHCESCGAKAHGHVADVSEEAAFRGAFQYCLKCGAANIHVRIGAITWRHKLRVF